MVKIKRLMSLPGMSWWAGMKVLDMNTNGLWMWKLLHVTPKYTLIWTPCSKNHWHSCSIDLFLATTYIIKISLTNLNSKFSWLLPYCLDLLFFHKTIIWGHIYPHSIMYLKSDKYITNLFRRKKERVLLLNPTIFIDSVNKSIIRQ